MNWEDIKTKLLSRKFWVMITTFVGIILVVLNVNVLTVEKLIGVITSFSILAIYILGETITDIANRQLSAGEKMAVSVAQKLSSRKFWAALISFITTLMFTLGVDALTIEQVEAMIMAIGTVAIYILSESAIDATKIKAELNQALKDVETEKESITEEIIGSVAPVLTRNWNPMYIFAPNNVTTEIYNAPNYLSVVASIAHLTQIFVEPNLSYGEKGDFFKCVLANDNDHEYFIPAFVVRDGNVAEADAGTDMDESPVAIGYAVAEATCDETSPTVSNESYEDYESEEETDELGDPEEIKG